MGLISGLILGVGGWLIWIALTYMGMAHAAAICSGTAVITAFLEGLMVGNIPDNNWLAAIALILMILGILSIGFNEIVTGMATRVFCCVSDDPPAPPDLDIHPPRDRRLSGVFRLINSPTPPNQLPLIS